jgi:hypothetical protein
VQVRWAAHPWRSSALADELERRTRWIILHEKSVMGEVATAAKTYNLNDGVNRAVTPSEAPLKL